MTQAICKRASQHSLNCELILVRKALRLAPRNRVCRLLKIRWRPGRTESQDASVGQLCPYIATVEAKGMAVRRVGPRRRIFQPWPARKVAIIGRVCFGELSGNCTTAPLNRIPKKGSNTCQQTKECAN